MDNQYQTHQPLKGQEAKPPGSSRGKEMLPLHSGKVSEGFSGKSCRKSLPLPSPSSQAGCEGEKLEPEPQAGRASLLEERWSRWGCAAEPGAPGQGGQRQRRTSGAGARGTPGHIPGCKLLRACLVRAQVTAGWQGHHSVLLLQEEPAGEICRGSTCAAPQAPVLSTAGGARG